MPTGERIIAADALGARWSRYSAMMRDCGHGGAYRCDGVLRKEEIGYYMDKLDLERNEAVRNNESTAVIDNRIRESMEMLHDMERNGVDGLFYLPPQFDNIELEPNLKARAAEILMRDDQENIGRVTQALVDRARGRYYNFDAVNGHTLQVRDRALAEITQIARKLGLI